MLPQYTNKKRPGRALIVEGGGMRGAFVGGVLASMVKHHPVSYFDLAIGVSSGSCSLAYYITEPHGATQAAVEFLKIWRHELAGSKLISYLNPLKGKTLLNQEYLVDELFGDKYRIKREVLDDPNSTPFYIVVMNMQTHESEYIRANSKNLLLLLKAATSLPIATKGKRKIGDRLFTDGGITDPLPVQAAIDAGYTDLTVILTNPRTFRLSAIGKWTSRLAFPRHRGVRHKLRYFHHEQYNRSYELVNNPPAGVKVHIIDPERALPIQMVDTDESRLNQTVELGLSAGRQAYTLRTPKWWQRIAWKIARLFGARHIHHHHHKHA